MTRADQLIVQRGLAPTRSAAQRLIDRGAVRWRLPRVDSDPTTWRAPRKAGDDLPEGCEVVVIDNAELRWASRAGLKLDGALTHTGIDVRDRICLDVGQSTGGFTDVLLARGAKHVVGVDVGHGQLIARLRSDARVTAIEGINARALEASMLPQPTFDFVCADLSFISLALVLPALAPFVARDALLLVKPQFELSSPSQIGKGGIVDDPALHARVEARIRDACAANGLRVAAFFDSSVTGGDGNREFFVHALPTQPRSAARHDRRLE
jgi:23S rRNA (cytidine1920-2'-O)/16S rRNA (cytidine1409-2'-O)-methyltransferase